LFEAPGAAAQTTFPLTSRLPVSRSRPAFGAGDADEPAENAWPLPQRPSTTLPPISANGTSPATEPATGLAGPERAGLAGAERATGLAGPERATGLAGAERATGLAGPERATGLAGAEPAAGPPATRPAGQPTVPAAGPPATWPTVPAATTPAVQAPAPRQKPFDAFSSTKKVAGSGEPPSWPAAETPAQPGQALVDALLPSRLPSRREIVPELVAEPATLNGSAAYSARTQAAPERASRPAPAQFEDGPTEVLGPFDIGMWSDERGQVAGPRGLPRRTRRTRPDEDGLGTGEHGDSRRVAITAAAVEQARVRASGRREGAGGGPPKPPKPPKTRGDRIRTGIRGLGQTMITLGLVVLLFVVYELWVTDLFNTRTQHKLSTALQKDWDQGDDPLVTAPSSGPVKPGTKVTRIPLGKGIANIYIPAFGADYVFTVVEGTGATQLAEGPGHYATSALPGQIGNFSIAGHRVGKGSPFLNLDKLRAGDAIVIETKSFWYTYRVLGNRATGDTAHGTLGIPGMQIVNPTDVDVIRPIPNSPAAGGKYPFITLTTCHPKFSARQRLIIHGQLDGKPWPKSQGNPPALGG
jgi:sortase A